MKPGRLRLHWFGWAPNPRKVELCIREKGIEDVEFVEVSLLEGAHRSPDFLALNPAGVLPVLETEQGVLTESLPIIEYLEELYPEPPLLGVDAWQRAETRTAERAIELGIFNRMATVFFNASEFFAGPDQMPELAERARRELPRRFELLELHMRRTGGGDPGPWVMGERFSLADITLFAGLEHGLRAGVTRDLWPDFVADLFDRFAQRPSVAGDVRTF